MLRIVLRLLIFGIQPILLTMASLLYLQQRQQRIDDVLINGIWERGIGEGKTRYQIVGIDNEGWQSKSNCHKSGSFLGQQYVWKPKNTSDAPLPKKRSMCETIDGRDVIIVGDSMSAQFFMTFLLAIWPWPTGQSISNYYSISHLNFQSTQTFHIPCSSPFHVSFVRNIYLSINRNDKIYNVNRAELNLPPKKVVAMSWVRVLERNHARRRNNIIVLNRGAHYTSDHILLTELQDTFMYLQQHHNDSLIIYRDTAKGHPEVKKHQQNQPPITEELPSSAYDEIEWNTYNYSQFNHQNSLVRNLIVQKFPHIVYMNIAKATNLRRDSHVRTTIATHHPLSTSWSYIYSILLLNSDHPHSFHVLYLFLFIRCTTA